MKNYFDFTLTGKKLLPIWLLFLVLFMMPYVYMVSQLQPTVPGQMPSMWFFPAFIMLIIGVFLITFYIAKLMIENVAYKGQSIVFNGAFGAYIGKVLLGFFLTIITLGIYGAWFARDIHRFFIDNSSYNGQPLKFKGSGGALFVILLLTIFLPSIAFGIAVGLLTVGSVATATSFVFIQQFFTMIIMIPYIYFLYKWMINIDYKGMNISWETNIWQSLGKIAVEMLLTFITLGIYMPMAMLRLYKYFADRTVASGEERKLNFGYDIDQLNDFLLIWGQTLLSIITLGVYYPWAVCKIYNRILSKTYLKEE